jgi:hypothetical protein
MAFLDDDTAADDTAADDLDIIVIFQLQGKGE